MIVYISAPYTLGDTALNVSRAIIVADALADCGYVPYIPHLTHFWHMIRPRSYEYWLKYDIEWLDKCDVVLRLSGESKGADIEVSHALSKGIPVVLSINELKQIYPIRNKDEAESNS